MVEATLLSASFSVPPLAAQTEVLVPPRLGWLDPVGGFEQAAAPSDVTVVVARATPR